MLDLIKTNLSKDRSVFVINHAEMADDYFDHKIRVSLQNKKIDKQARRKRDSVGKAIVHATKYDVIFWKYQVRIERRQKKYEFFILPSLY